ncbi:MULTISPECIES: hypothetical protein [unclassified Moorena]|uniref:hypothetical protein n=1 Tax=unclassified Moorena TaxID=2683338 RepID=UPI0013FF34B5|nr:MULTISPECIES: hypothetical protein [unclassified Moorena]NEO15461.1 hypothetical protein [Moorena sp. SIO3E8]NEQ03463.1 hypothetical protein [Moorena sp. SIO3F7]
MWRESGIGNRESGIGNRESGIGNRESGKNTVYLIVMKNAVTIRLQFFVYRQMLFQR